MKHLLHSVISGLRNMFAVGVVTSLDDTGAAKTVNVSTGTNVNRADVEVLEPWGFTANPPADGMITIVFAIGGDPANLMALPPANPSARMGALQVGEAAIYGADGSRVHIRAGGVIEIWGGASVTVNTQTCTINAPEGVTINGNAVLEGNLSVSGNIS